LTDGRPLWTWFAANNAGQAHYRKHGTVPLNDLTYTPGATDGMTAKQLCDPKFRTGTIRNVTTEEKKLVCAEYGIPNLDLYCERCRVAAFPVKQI
jgi:hypothetical protein